MKPSLKQLFLSVLAACGFSSMAHAQYFYQDIYANQQANANMALLKTAKVQKQTVQSMDADLSSDNDFICERVIEPSYRQMTAVTKSRATGRAVTVSSFNTKGLLSKVVDSTEASTTVLQYHYNDKAQLTSIQSTSVSTVQHFRMAEARTARYDSSGRLLNMLRQRSANPADTTLIIFKTNDKLQVTEEQEVGKGVHTGRIYYDYDSAGHLSAVLRYNAVRKRMLPDYMFEYDDRGRLLQMTTVNAETGDYTRWQYQYQENGLPLKETCYGKQKELLGMVKYGYELAK
ncbi:hypothetical protein DCC81_24010 [Chitinophaga parva]|uniref:Sugar-binding protein n=1 Tax=Chitinophaga parva TaxID=2169414 RepID=A0A2T7BBF4_9BACT|nr:hypothetical protein [Chitinophaga parva]PUZ21658.1 hypothetical protein DCC81_24010 [Chitinophaga parva]